MLLTSEKFQRYFNTCKILMVVLDSYGRSERTYIIFLFFIFGKTTLQSYNLFQIYIFEFPIVS